MKIISKSARKANPDFWKLDMSIGAQRSAYLKFLALGLSEEGARENSGFKGNVIHSRVKPTRQIVEDRYPDDWTGYTDEQVEALNRYAEEEAKKKRIIYSLAQTIKAKREQLEDAGILVGYKGKSSLDAGCFYAPYIPLMMYGVSETPQLQKIHTRYDGDTNELLVDMWIQPVQAVQIINVAIPTIHDNTPKIQDNIDPQFPLFW